MSNSIPQVRVVVHLGPEKTGTTALAKYFTQLDSRGLLPESLTYPSGDLWFNRSDRIQKHRVELERVANNFKAGWELHREDELILRTLAAKVRQSGAPYPTVVLVAETALANMNEADLSRLLLEFFDKVEYVVAARVQETGIRSLMAQRIRDKASSESSFDPKSYLRTQSISFQSMDYALVATKWKSSDPRIKLRFLPYLDSDAATFGFIDRFFAVLKSGRPSESAGIEGFRIHPTFSAEGMSTLSTIKRRKKLWGWLPLVGRKYDKQFEKAWKIFHNSAAKGSIEPSGKYYEPWNLTPRDKMWVRQYYAESNATFLDQVDRKGFEREWKLWEQNLRMDTDTKEIA